MDPTAMPAQRIAVLTALMDFSFKTMHVSPAAQSASTAVLVPMQLPVSHARNRSYLYRTNAMTVPFGLSMAFTS